MKTFKQFLEDRQLKFFSTHPVELYHASNTGANNEVLQSFKTQGIQTNIAKGYGQGEGFYVWSGRAQAEKHAQMLVKDEDLNFVITNARTDGKPMIVTVQDTLEPENWDLDYEANGRKITKWIYDNFDYFKDILTQYYEKNTGGENDWFPYERLPKNQLLRYKAVQGTNTRKQGTKPEHEEANIYTAAAIGNIVNRLQNIRPDVVRPFEERFFANMAPNIAIKYVGSKPLKIKRIEVLENGKWQTV